MTNQTNEPTAPTAVKQSIPAGADVESIAMKPAASKLIGEETERYVSMSTQQVYIKAGFERYCDWCEKLYTAKRSTSKFCSGRCRTAAHEARHYGE